MLEWSLLTPAASSLHGTEVRGKSGPGAEGQWGASHPPTHGWGPPALKEQPGFSLRPRSTSGKCWEEVRANTLATLRGVDVSVYVYIFFQMHFPPNLHTWSNPSKENTYDLDKFFSIKPKVRVVLSSIASIHWCLLTPRTVLSALHATFSFDPHLSFIQQHSTESLSRARSCAKFWG